MKKLVVNTDKSILLSKYILNKFKSLNYNSFMKALRNKDIKINNERTNKDVYLKNGDILEIYIKDNILFNINDKINYAYEDENIIIAYKWQGILSNNETNLDILEPTFEELVKKDKNDENIRICHRLDRNTEGLVIFSKSKEIFDEIILSFKKNEIEKHYLAYVNNYEFKKNHDYLEAYISKNSKQSISQVTNKKSSSNMKIITEYTVVNQNKDKNYAILDIVLHTR